MTTRHDQIWDGAYKIPWEDPAFSRRMLAEHLSQDHDLASRRVEWIAKQILWIHERLLEGRPSRILDLGCGPGFYAHRLAMLGHHCHGIDFGPASIEYARQQRPRGASCDFVEADIRQVEFGGPYDVAMILHGEFNVFSPLEASSILRHARASLTPSGRMLIETQTPATVEQMGCMEPSETQLAQGLFSDHPHVYRTENRWLPEHAVTIQTFTITETSTGQTRQFRSTTKAWTDDDVFKLLTEAGFCDPTRYEDWPAGLDSLALWGATPT